MTNYKTVKLSRANGNGWQLKINEIVLHTFSVLDSVEAARYASAWLTSFSEIIKLETPDECNPGDEDTAKARSAEADLLKHTSR